MSGSADEQNQQHSALLVLEHILVAGAASPLLFSTSTSCKATGIHLWRGKPVPWRGNMLRGATRRVQLRTASSRAVWLY
jgi:hypothetical protein